MIDKTADDPSGSFDVIYPDGSCLACQGPPGGVDASFTRNPTLYTAVTQLMMSGQTPREALVEYGIDGLRRSVVISGAASDPVWSSRDALALTRGGWIWAGSPGRLRRVARGSAPSWSPDGRQIAFVRNGWLMIGPVRGRRFRRLVHGTAPAWSPDNTWIAFLDKRHRLSLVRAAGGRVRRVGEVTGWTVDWQPLPAKPPVACLTPAGSTVLASSDTAIITADHGQSTYFDFFTSSYMGCFRADGRERLLASYPYPGYATEDVIKSAVAGTYAALATNTTNSHDQSQSSTVDVFDLRTGARLPDRGGEEGGCQNQTNPPCASTVDQLVLGTDAVNAARTTVRDDISTCSCTIEQIQASDSTGVHTLDSVSEPNGSPTALTNLVLTRDTLTWEHNRTPRSAQLQPSGRRAGKTADTSTIHAGSSSADRPLHLEL